MTGRLIATVGGIVIALVALGFFMTWGDEGNRLWNTAKTLSVLLVLAGGMIALLLWAASTSGEGS